MQRWKAIIAEDEPVLRAELKEKLEKVWPELDICAEAADGIEAVRAFERHAPQILFLDIQMPGVSGIEVAKQVGSKAHIVFVTAYDKYALEAFEKGAVDYVMKPFSVARLMTTVGRLKQKVASAPANLEGLLQSLAQATAPREHIRWITAAQGDELQLITVEEICYFKAEGADARAVTPAAEALVGQTIADLSVDLDPALFVPVNPTTLVNVNAIAGIQRDVRGQMRVALKQRTEVLELDPAYAPAVAKATGLATEAPDEGRHLATVLFTDIVGSTATAARLGDHAWRSLLQEHDHLCRKTIARFHGCWVKSTGDGVLATFDSPARAIRCAQEIGEAARALGIALRASAHTGECEMHDGDVRGIAVHIAARLLGLAGPGEVLVSATVRDLVGGSGLAFEDRGEQVLRGVPAPTRVLAVATT